MHRARVVLIVSTLALTFVLVAGAVALGAGAGSDRTHTYGIALDRLAPDAPVAVDVTLPGPDAQSSRVAFVRHDEAVSAFLASDPRYGCALTIVGEPDFAALYGRSPNPEIVAFYDNCGGAVYGSDGACNGGPCRRNLDEYPVTVENGRATVDLSERRSGGYRLGVHRLPDWCTHTNPAVAIGAVPGGPADPDCR